MAIPTYKYHPISTDDDDGRPSPSIIELTNGKPSEDNYRSISNYQSAFSYSRQVNLHTLTGRYFSWSYKTKYLLYLYKFCSFF